MGEQMKIPFKEDPFTGSRKQNMQRPGTACA